MPLSRSRRAAGLIATLALPTTLLILSAAPSSAAPPNQTEDAVILETPSSSPKPWMQVPRDSASARSPGGRIQLGPFTSVQVNVDEFGDNIVGDAANEPSIAIDPTDPNNIVIGWRQFDTIADDFRQAGYAYSHDGGQTWTFPGVIEPGVFRSDPVLGADLQGHFYYFSLTTDGFNFDCQLFKSTNAGQTWPASAAAFGGDKAWMTIDRTTGLGQGNIYAKWQSFANCCGLDTFTRSTNGGLSFEDPVFVPLGPTFGTLNVGPNGEVYAAGIWAIDFQDFDRLVFARSTNAANPFQTPDFDLALDIDLGGDMPFATGPNPQGLLGQVQVVSDHSNGAGRGNVYVLASLDPPGPDPLDVKFIRSTDGGQTWSNPIRINNDLSTGNWQWFGTIAVAPNGRIDVVWNDTRNSGQDNLSELFFAFSNNAGQTWSGNVPLSPMFDSFLGWPQQNKIGDYYDMISDDDGFNLAWAATFNGEQDVYHLRVSVDCNDNGVFDATDITNGTSEDVNTNGVPDECESACAEDLDGDGTVGPGDLSLLLGAWGPCPGCPADFNSDGAVKAADLALLLGAWGLCS